MGMTDAVTPSAPSRLPISRPPALQRIWTRNTRSSVRAPRWQNKSQFQYIQHDAGWLRSCFVVPLSARLSFSRDQPINIGCCRSGAGDLIFVLYSLLSRAFTIYGRETPATACYLSGLAHVFFRFVDGYPSVIDCWFCFALLRTLRGAGMRQFRMLSKLPGKATCFEPIRTFS